jgi:holo-[acyl-carrier protein] synthase
VSPRPAADLAAGAAERLAGSLGSGVVGVGIDAVDIDRFRTVLARRRHLGARLFTAGELAYADRAADPVPRLATRFAAKEAVMKALGVGLGAFEFHDIDVVRRGLDAPFLILHGAAAERAGAAGAVGWHLSLTHTDRVALAVVVADATGGDSGPD